MLATLLLSIWSFVAAAFTVTETPKCRYGCILYGGVGDARERYEVTWADIEMLAKVVRFESGPRFVPEEASATAWALVQGWAVVNGRRSTKDRIALAAYVGGYSAACSRTWASGGTKYSARITPRADRCRRTTWDDLPKPWREFATSFFVAQVPNRTPGLYHVLARGFERWAGPKLIGPYYATTEDRHPGGNAYYRTIETAAWTEETIRIRAATSPLTSRRLQLQFPGRERGGLEQQRTWQRASERSRCARRQYPGLFGLVAVCRPEAVSDGE